MSEKSNQQIDLNQFRLSQDFAQSTGVKRATSAIPLQKPSKQLWFAVSPNEEHRFPAAVIEFGEESKEMYLVGGQLLTELEGEWSPRLLCLCQTKNGSCFWWPIRQPDEEGKLDSWNESAHSIIADHSGEWIRLLRDQELGRYEAMTTTGFQKPIWPNESLEELMARTVVKGKYIDSINHHVVRKLRGME